MELFSVHVWGEYGYFIIFSDDYSRFGYVDRKSNALDTFIEFKAKSIIGYTYKVTSIISR